MTLRLTRNLKNRSFLGNIIMLSGSTAIGQLLLVVTSPVLTRLFSPSDFGIFSQYIALISLVTVVASFRYELAIPLPTADQIAVNLVYVSLYLVLGVSLLTAVALTVFGNLLTEYTKSLSLTSYLWLIPFSVAGTAVCQVLNYWAVRKNRFGSLSKVRLQQSVGQLVGQISIGWVVAGPLGLFLGDVIGRLVGVAYLAKLFLMDSASIFPGFRKVIESSKEYSRFPLFMSLAALLNALALQMPFILLPTYFDVASTGLYFQAYRTLILPATLIGGAVSQVFFSASSKLKQDPEKLKELTTRLVFSILAINAPLYLGIVFVGPDVFGLVFGQQWSKAGHIAQILSPMILIWSAASPLSTLLIVGNRLKESLIFTTIELILKILPILIGAHYRSLTVAVAGISVFGVILGLLSLWRFLRIADISVREIAGILRKIFVCNIVLILSLSLAMNYSNLSIVVLVFIAPVTIYLSVRKQIQGFLPII